MLSRVVAFHRVPKNCNEAKKGWCLSQQSWHCHIDIHPPLLAWFHHSKCRGYPSSSWRPESWISQYWQSNPYFLSCYSVGISLSICKKCLYDVCKKISHRNHLQKRKKRPKSRNADITLTHRSLKLPDETKVQTRCRNSVISSSILCKHFLVY